MGVYSLVHVKRCVVSCSCMFQRGKSGVVWFICCARVRLCALVSVASIVFIVGAAVWSSLFIFLLLR